MRADPHVPWTKCLFRPQRPEHMVGAVSETGPKRNGRLPRKLPLGGLLGRYDSQEERFRAAVPVGTEKVDTPSG